MRNIVFFTSYTVQSLLARMYESTGRAKLHSPGIDVGVGFSVAQMLKFLVKVFMSLYLLKLLMDKLILCMLVDIGLKFYTVPSRHT